MGGEKGDSSKKTLAITSKCGGNSLFTAVALACGLNDIHFRHTIAVVQKRCKDVVKAFETLLFEYMQFAKRYKVPF